MLLIEFSLLIDLCLLLLTPLSNHLLAGLYFFLQALALGYEFILPLLSGLQGLLPVGEFGF